MSKQPGAKAAKTVGIVGEKVGLSEGAREFDDFSDDLSVLAGSLLDHDGATSLRLLFLLAQYVIEEGKALVAVAEYVKRGERLLGDDDGGGAEANGKPILADASISAEELRSVF